MSFEGKIALVTGASRGIGQAIAQQLAQSGAQVIGTATSQAGVDTIEQSLMAWSGRGMMLDVTDSASIDQLLTELETREEMPNILVNNAGITRDMLLDAYTNLVQAKWIADYAEKHYGCWSQPWYMSGDWC
ncbi:MAG: SDR family NAD(P)-dependent oxidoreductase [Legionellales bacterium]|nr:SDR family NAD(P)-dependent oxidoreductase [Legionellales bacterium]